MARTLYSYLDNVESHLELGPWDGKEPIDMFKTRRAKEMKYLSLRNSPMLKAHDSNGKPLYRLTRGLSFVRTKPLSKSRREEVIARDKKCVECDNSGPYEVHHLIRYIDGGSNDMDNLVTLCEPCHRSKGGQA